MGELRESRVTSDNHLSEMTVLYSMASQFYSILFKKLLWSMHSPWRQAGGRLKAGKLVASSMASGVS